MWNKDKKDKDVEEQEEVQEADEIQKLKDEAEKWKNEYYRALADTQNLRKLLEEEQREAIRFRSLGFLEKLLPSLDSFYIALSAEPTNQESKNYQTGFRFIYRSINEALSEEGVKEILPSVGDKFDPLSMHAVETEETEDEKQVGTVSYVYTKGYFLHERLVQPARVKVYKGKEVPVEEPVNEKPRAEEA